MFKFLIIIRPLGLLYGSAGAFLSPENLVGKSGAKFPPDAATLSGLILGTNQEKPFTDHQELKMNLTVAGAFWAQDDDLKEGSQDFYVPIPRSRIIDEKDTDEWKFEDGKWNRSKEDQEINAAYSWQSIHAWSKRIDLIRKNWVAEIPWKFLPILHSTLQDNQRHVLERDGLFLENAVQMREDSCLVYLSTHELPDGWYRFGGENHIVEVTSQKIDDDILELFQKPIGRSFALICPAVWGTHNLSCRYPNYVSFNNKRPEMLTDRPVPFRYRMGKNDAQNKRASRLSIGRYAVPSGTVYVVKHPLNKTWWDFPLEWFPSGEGLPLRQLGCGLCLPIEIKGVE